MMLMAYLSYMLAEVPKSHAFFLMIFFVASY
jgi:hypothetical protein